MKCGEGSDFMRALIGSFLVLCFVNSPASAHHYFDEGLGFLHNNALVINHSIMVIFGLIAIVTLIMSFNRIWLSKTKS